MNSQEVVQQDPEADEIQALKAEIVQLREAHKQELQEVERAWEVQQAKLLSDFRL